MTHGAYWFLVSHQTVHETDVSGIFDEALLKVLDSLQISNFYLLLPVRNVLSTLKPILSLIF